MKSSMRKLIDAAALSVLVLGTGIAGTLAAAPAEAVQGIRVVSTICAWEDIGWGEMSDAERRQWMALGWSQNRWESDDENVYPASWSKDWDELNVNEQAAAWSLGYTPRSWDADDICP